MHLALRRQFLSVIGVGLVASASFAEIAEFTVTQISDSEVGLVATVVTFESNQNRGFALLDVPAKVQGDNITNHFDAKKHGLMINGGYFDSKFEPDCYCKIGGKVINAKDDPRRSGFVAIDQTGRITLLARGANYANYPTVLQSGPYLIDPGGKVGIRSKTGRKARRTLIGITTDQRLVIVITEPIFLIDLANSILKSLPKLERLLNLDGGPSTGLRVKGIKVVNRMPVRNYLFRKVEIGPQK